MMGKRAVYSDEEDSQKLQEIVGSEEEKPQRLKLTTATTAPPAASTS